MCLVKLVDIESRHDSGRLTPSPCRLHFQDFAGCFTFSHQVTGSVFVPEPESKPEPEPEDERLFTTEDFLGKMFDIFGKNRFLWACIILRI